jgi:hypothetical protein
VRRYGRNWGRWFRVKDFRFFHVHVVGSKADELVRLSRDCDEA